MASRRRRRSSTEWGTSQLRFTGRPSVRRLVGHDLAVGGIGREVVEPGHAAHNRRRRRGGWSRPRRAYRRGSRCARPAATRRSCLPCASILQRDARTARQKPGSLGRLSDNLPTVSNWDGEDHVRTALGRLADTLSNPNFRRYASAQFLHGAGMWAHHLAEVWLVYAITDSAFVVGLTIAIRSGSAVVLAPVAGTLADRMDRRRLLASTQAAKALVAGTPGPPCAGDARGPAAGGAVRRRRRAGRDRRH